MPPKNKDPKQATKQYKIGTNVKDIIPTSIKQLPREGFPSKIPTDNLTYNIQPKYKPYNIPEEWPGDEIAKNFDFGVDSNLIYVDKEKFKLPPSFTLASSQITFWRRPKEFLLPEIEAENLNSNTKVTTLLQKKESRRTSIYQRAISQAQNVNYEASKLKLAFISKPTDDIEFSSPAKIRQPESSEKQFLTIFETSERLETEQEMEDRKKRQESEKLALQQQNIKDKKKLTAISKKEEPVEEGPITIREVKLSNMNMSGFYPFYSKWVCSIFQIIKDRNIRDANTGKGIWSKIYPQSSDGIPVYNKSGRYWVKLYFMGKERKIEIDDKMPTSVKKNSMFPRSIKLSELWPMLITKALLKLNSFNWDSSQNEIEIGDGSIIYALMGFIPQTIELRNMNNDNWVFLKMISNDFHYENKNNYIITYCSASYRPHAPSNLLSSQKDQIFETITQRKKSEEEFGGRTQKRMMTSSELDSKKFRFSAMGLNEEEEKKVSPERQKKNPKLNLNTIRTMTSLMKEKPTYVNPGFGYSIVETFYNENFNMVYVKERSENEIKLRQEYHELTKVSMQKMPKEEKLEHRKKKKEIREKLHEESQKRIELMTKAPIQYRAFRVKTGVAKVPVLSFLNPFTPQEYYLAKKCIINKLSRPPNYDIPELKNDDKSVYSQSVNVNKGEDNSFVIKPLDEFHPSAIEPIKKSPIGGAWILDKDLTCAFEYIQIFHDLNKLAYQEVIFIPTNNEQDLTRNENSEILLLERRNYEESESNSQYQNSQQLPLILGFSSCRANNGSINPEPHCILQKYDFDYLEPISNYKTIAKAMDGINILLDNNDYAFRVLVNSPLGYCLWVASEMKITFLSYSEYLIKHKNFSNKNIPIEFINLEKDKLQIPCKFIIDNIHSDLKLLIRLRNPSDSYLIKYFRFKLCEVPEDKNKKIMLESPEGVHMNLFEMSAMNVIEFSKFDLKTGKKYILILEGILPYNVLEGNAELEVLTQGENNSNITIDLLERIEPLEYIDKYIPTKYGIIFRERLFLSSEQLYSSIFLRIVNIIGNINQVKDTKQAKKGAHQNQEPEFNESELMTKRLIKIELFEEDNLISYAYGHNSVLLSNLVLNSNKETGKNYYLQASFELREWSDCILLNEETKNIHWILKIFSNDTLILIKDTQKQEREKAIKKEWEDKEPGRAEKAKKARKKYLAYLKKEEQGIQALDENELELINEVRVSKKQREEEAKVNLQQKGGKAKKEIPKKGKKAEENNGQQQNILNELLNKEMPKSGNHTMKELTSFLEHLEGERLLEEHPLHGGLINIRSEDEKRALREIGKASTEDAVGMLINNFEFREKILKIQKEEKKKIIEGNEEFRKNFKSSFNEYVKLRDEVKKNFGEKNQSEKNLVNICKNDKPNVEEFAKILDECKNIKDFNLKLIEIAEKFLENAKIMNLVEKLNNSINVFDLENIEICIEEINKWAIDVDNELIEKAMDIIEEAKANPNFIQEKQNELKKGSKKTGKK